MISHHRSQCHHALNLQAMAYVGLDALCRNDPSSDVHSLNSPEFSAHGSSVEPTATVRPAVADDDIVTAWPVMYIHPSEGLGKSSSSATDADGSTPGVIS